MSATRQVLAPIEATRAAARAGAAEAEAARADVAARVGAPPRGGASRFARRGARARLGLLAGAACAALAVGLAPSTAHAQASQTEMQAFPMPPPSGYFATKNFGYVGDYGYYTTPPTAVYGSGAAASDYKYVKYTGVSGKRVFVYGAWGTSVPPNPPGPADACGHSHASWGAWARYSLVVPGYGTVGGWVMFSGGGTSGERNASTGKCVQKNDTSLADFDPRFGWGVTFREFDLRSTTVYKDVVVGALSNTHGWGTCPVPSGSFPACKEPSYIIGYTLP